MSTQTAQCSTLHNDILEQLAIGDIPAQAESLMDFAKSLVRVNAKTSQALAVIITIVRRDHLLSAGEWMLWAGTDLNLQGAYLHHLHRIGKLLVGLLDAGDKCSMRHYQRLFGLSINALYEISRLTPDQIAPWLSHYREVETMTREQVRDAVAAYLGEEVATRDSRQPELPGFEVALDALAATPADQFEGLVKDETQSAKGLKAGLCVFGAALEYQVTKTLPDAELLSRYKSVLISAIADIDEALARTADQMDN